jgi:pilus assembly protein TadC
MAKLSAFYEIIGRLFSRASIRSLGGILDASGVRVLPEAFAGFIVVLTSLMIILSYLLLSSVQPFKNALFRVAYVIFTDFSVQYVWFVPAFVLAFSIVATVAIVGLIAYVLLLLSAQSRKQFVDNVLPDFLLLAASNVRAGMSIDQALWYAAKPEFGTLSKEVEIVSKQTFGGVPFARAIDGLANRFDSKSVKRAVALIKQGMASGGELAEILERTAEDSRNMQLISKEIAASLIMYIIFIVFAASIGTPFLFAVSTKLIGILEGVFLSNPALASAPSSSILHPAPPSVSSELFYYFTFASAVVTAVFASLIIGVIRSGSKRDGIRFVPFILGGSLLIFFLVSSALDIYLSSAIK